MKDDIHVQTFNAVIHNITIMNFSFKLGDGVNFEAT